LVWRGVFHIGLGMWGGEILSKIAKYRTRFASISGTPSGKSGEDMSTPMSTHVHPVHHVKTPLKTYYRVLYVYAIAADVICYAVKILIM